MQRKLTICAVGSARSCHVQNRVKCFAELGHTVYLITDSAVGLEGVKEITLPVLSIPGLRRIYQLIVCFWVIRRCKPDIVHVHFAQRMFGWIAAAVNHHPLVVSVMGGDILFEEQGTPDLYTRKLTLQFLKSADLITAKSDYLISVLNEIGRFGAKAIKVVWGVDLSQFHKVDATPLRQKLGLAPDDRLILSPKILDPFYNIHLIVEAMPKILATHPNVKLLITEYLANAPYKANIAAQVERLGLQDRVIFVGEISQSDMPDYYNLAEVVVAIPPSDGLPQTLLEAMACETVNVLSRIPHYKEVVTHKESAYFVDIHPEDIAAGIVYILENAELRNKIVRNGLQIIKTEADFEMEVKRVEEKYYELLTASSNWPRRRERGKMLLMILLSVIINRFAHKRKT